MVMTQLTIESEQKERTIISESRAWAMRKRKQWGTPFACLRVFPKKGVINMEQQAMQSNYEIKIKGSYIKLRSLYIGIDAMQNLSLSAGQILISIQDDEDFLIEGNLNSAGYLTGMTKLYRKLELKEGDSIFFSVSDTGNIVITSIIKSPINESFISSQNADAMPEITLPEIPLTGTIFERKNCKHIHFEAFRPQNLDVWKPETEVDVFLAFGVLQEFTDYIYCRGASLDMLKKIGLIYTETSKPDAILIDRTTDQYLIAEWKKLSSDYKKNHKADEADLVVCWEDNEIDRTKLPPRVLELRSIAKEVVSKMFRDTKIIEK